MPSNPYDNPDFAKQYVFNQLDRSKNRYEWEVTHPATLQFLDESVDRVLDYGCGSGIFTAGITQTGRKHWNPSLESIGTDASPEMVRYATMLATKTEGVNFQKWDATSKDESTLQDRGFHRVFAKLVLNYVSGQNLRESVMPRLRECLTDDGLLIAVLPNPLREAGYSNSKNTTMNEIEVNVGNFSPEASTQSYHHTYKQVVEAANYAGFAYGRVLGLPDVRFEPYKRQLMAIAQPMPMIFDTLNAAKRWLYVFGATDASAENFDSSVNRFERWRMHQFPEIADRAHISTRTHEDPDVYLPLQGPHEALYDYLDMSDPSNKKVFVVEGNYAENLSSKQKIALVKRLAKQGLRPNVKSSDFLTTA